MTASPVPPIPATVNLRKFATMPLDVARLRDSEMARDPNPEGFRCAVIAWCVAWHQVPAGSLPDDDRALADLIGIGRTARAVKEWKELRPTALRGFVKCSDGLLYHGVVVEMAIAAWGSQVMQRYRSTCGAIKKQAQRKKVKPQYPGLRLWITENVPEALPYLSRWTKNDVSEDIEESPEARPEGRPPNVPGLSPSPTAPTEQSRSDCSSSNKRFPGDGDISPPERTADVAQPHVNPDATARILAECTRASLEEPTEQNSIVSRWVRNGATPTQVANALADARKSMPFPRALKAGYVDTILVAIMQADRDAKRQADARIERTQAQITEQRQRETAPPPSDLMAPYRKRAASA